MDNKAKLLISFQDIKKTIKVPKTASLSDLKENIVLKFQEVLSNRFKKATPSLKLLLFDTDYNEWIDIDEDDEFTIEDIMVKAVKCKNMEPSLELEPTDDQSDDNSYHIDDHEDGLMDDTPQEIFSNTCKPKSFMIMLLKMIYSAIPVTTMSLASATRISTTILQRTLIECFHRMA